MRSGDLCFCPVLEEYVLRKCRELDAIWVSNGTVPLILEPTESPQIDER